MSYFELYEKTKEVRRQVKIGSLWRVTKSTTYDSGFGYAYNTVGTLVEVIKIDSQYVRYIINRADVRYYQYTGFIRPIDVFLETFIPV